MTQPLRVLIAEDNPLDAKLVLRELRQAGFEPDWQRVDTEAAYLSQLHANWDIILSDYMMPEFGGPRALELLKQSGLDIPFIIISGTIGEDAAVAAMKQGATDYLLKDRLTRLGMAVSQALEQHRLRKERKAADQALRDSEERFREVVQNIGEVFWMMDVDMKQMLFVSSAYERIWGRTCASLYANPMAWADAIHSDDRGRVLVAAKDQIPLGTYDEEYRIVRPDGTIRWISDRAFPVRNGTGVVYRIAGVATDITERKHAEELLLESNRRFNDMLQNVQLISAMLDTHAEITYCNDYLLNLTGWARDEIIGKDWFSTFIPPENMDMAGIFKDLLDNAPKAWHHENEILTRSGERRVIRWNNSVLRSISGDIIGVTTIGEDITERKRGEAALRESEKQLSLITNNVPALISYLDRNLRYQFVNNAYEKMFDLTREQLLGMSLKDVIGDEAFLRVEPYAGRALTNECVTFESHIVRSGKTTHLIVTYVPDAQPDGSVKGLFTMATDVTAIKHVEEELRKSKDQLHQSQKMDAIGQLAGGVAHDFNNQLSVILGYANILSAQVEPKLSRFAENICTAARRSADLTQKLLVFARKGQAQTAPFDVHQILAETIEMLERSVDRRIELCPRLGADSAIIIGNASQLQNAFLNLGINARDAMPNGGTLIYQTESIALDAAFCASQRQDMAPGRYLKLTVTDSGTGMSDEVKKHLFEPFFTTKPIGKGTGLGLASVYGTVAQHAGALTVDSTLGNGTSFTIYLPLADQTAHQSAAKSAVLQSVKGVRIMIVEDEEILRTMLAYILSDLGHEVQEAEDGLAALAFYQTHWRTIDLVFLDMIMPGMSGHETFQALKTINPDIKAVLVTGYSLNSEVQDILNDGVLAFLQKPFEPDVLKKAIENIMTN